VNRAVVLRGGTVFDGVAPAGVAADVRIQDGTIQAVAPGLSRDGAREIDASGAWVTPGFVDAHSHGDLAVLSGLEMELRARAGVTTEVVGQDGLGFAGAPDRAAEVITDLLNPITGERPPTWWSTVAAYLRRVDAGAFARVATLAPHGTIRAAVVGSAPRPATEKELLDMQGLVSAAVADGAVGLSSGLSYPPALWSDTDELVALASAVPAGGCRYVTHLRDYGEGFRPALEEALEIGRRSGQPVHLSHFHVSGPGRAGTAGDHLARLDAAVREGLDITMDSYPYTSACTFLTTVLPTGLQGLPGHVLAETLADPDRSVAVASELDVRGPGATVSVGWDAVLLAGLASTELRRWDGRAVSSIAAAEGTTSGAVVVEAVRRLAGNACILVPQGHMDNVRTIASGRRQVVGSDGIPGSGVPHPRASGTFLRFLRWARDGVIPVPVAEMVARMTGRTARLFGLPVGVLAPGRPADVLVLDPAALSDGPDLGRYTPRAVRWSFVAGHGVVDDGRWMAPRLQGLALRRAI
jgi:N-acyl-D-amino-acid deacylase